ncbi:MAG: hypothetical protein CMO42_11525 [Verrucomicrobiales bacterium]|jgi:TPR repeat protein|nr:hypothetical protein [Verrucomicrobiales bacterium]
MVNKMRLYIVMKFYLIVPLLIFFNACSKDNNDDTEKNKNQQDQVKVEVAPNTEDASYQLEVISNEDSSKDEINQDEEQEAELIPEVKELIEKALEGDPDAQLFLGQRYQEGNGVKQNNTEAIKWLKLSAEQGNVYAPHILKKLEEGTDQN